MTIQELIKKWKYIGSPDASEIESTTYTDIANKAFNLFASEVYNYTFRTLTTVANTALYEKPTSVVNSIVYTYDTADLSATISSTTGLNGETYAIINSFPMSGVSIWTDTYLLEEIKDLKTQLKAASKKEIIRIQGTQLKVIPTPTDIHYINYITKDVFTFATITDELAPILDNLYCAEQLLYLATKRMSVSGVTVGGSLVNYPGDKLVQLSKTYREEANKLSRKIKDRINLFL